MRLTKIHIRSFGKLKDVHLSFDDGINLFYGDNESGKTTIHTFIKSMLFGMERGKGRAALNDTFSRYEPWDQPNYYAGTLWFTSGGKNFVLERNFDKYQKMVRLICEDDGEELSPEHGDLTVLLGGLTQENYDNTISVGQLKAETNQSLASQLQNYATNFYATGQSDIHLDGALQRLNLQKKEVEKKILSLKKEKDTEKISLQKEAEYIHRDILKTDEKIKNTQEYLQSMKAKEVPILPEEEKKQSVTPWILSGAFLIVAIICFILNHKWTALLTLVLAVGTLFTTKLKKKQCTESVDRSEEDDNKELRKRLSWELEHLTEERKEKVTMYQNLYEQIRELDEESLDEDLELGRNAILLAIDRIQALSKDVHKELSRVLNDEASKILFEITAGKYTRLFIDEKLNMSVFTEDKMVDIQKLSRGTIEQIYFALRMASTKVLYEEEYPIVLDDTFAYYDDDRAKNTIEWLKKNKKQVLIFTCHKREAELSGLSCKTITC